MNSDTPAAASMPAASSEPETDFPWNSESIGMEDEAARKKYAFCGAIGGVAVQLFFFIFNYFSSTHTEAFLDLASGGVLLTVPFIIKYTKHFQWGYRLGIFAMIFINAYTMMFPTHDATAVVLGFFSVPVVLFYLLGLREGLGWVAVILAIFGVYFGLPELFFRSTLSARLIVDHFTCFGILAVFAAILEWFRQKNFHEFVASNRELSKAVAHQHVLEGLVPICSFCKKIRNDNGFWQNLEGYLIEHTPAHISNGICDSCAAQDRTLTRTASFEVPPEVHSLFAWKSSEEELKRKYTNWVIWVGVPVLVAFSLRDFFSGAMLESIGKLVIGALLVGVAALLKSEKNSALAHQLAVAVAFVLFAFMFFTPTPDSSDHLWIFLFPLTAPLVVGFRYALVWCAGMGIFAVSIFTLPFFTSRYDWSTDTIFFFWVTYLLICFFSLAMERLRDGYSARIRSQMRELECVYEGIRNLKGLVPVCSVCKSIRNDEGYWTRVDFHLYKTTGMQLSHGICPDCLAQEIPEVYEEMKSNGEL